MCPKKGVTKQTWVFFSCVLNPWIISTRRQDKLLKRTSGAGSQLLPLVKNKKKLIRIAELSPALLVAQVPPGTRSSLLHVVFPGQQRGGASS